MPAKYTSSQARQSIRRSLRSVLDPHPTEKQCELVKEKFNKLCPYCGKQIDVLPGDSHLDHIDSKGPNHISNRLYACAKCNSKEKRDKDWRVFLQEKALTEEEYLLRKNLIEEWIEKNAKDYVRLSKEIQVEIDNSIELAISGFDSSLQTLRELQADKNN